MSTETLTQRKTFTQKTLTRSGKLPELLAFSGYVALLCYAIPRHEPWADEAQAWQLARSVSIHDLFFRYLREEGSPGLWHLLLAGLSRLNVSYSGYHWFAGIVATIGVALLIFLSPFPRSIRLALPFTFFFAFQYAVVARSYVLVPLLLFCAALAWRRSPIFVAIPLGLLGNVAAHALMISVGFVLLYIVEVLCSQRETGDRKQLIVAGTLLAGLYGFALWTVLPHPSDLTYLAPFQKHVSVADKLSMATIRAVVSICIAVMKPGILAVPLWGFIAVRLWKARRIYYLLPIFTFMLFSSRYVNFWHAGLVMPTVVTVFWIAWPEVRQQRIWSPLTVGIACFMVMQCGWTFYALRYHPYSSAPETARFLSPRIAAGDAIALTYVDHDELGAYHSTAIAPYFEHPIFLNQRSPFWIWRSNENTTQQLLDALSTHPPIVVVLFNSSFEKFDPAKDLKGIRVEYLLRHGYRMTHAFCGEKPERFMWREETCDLIFEPERTPPLQSSQR